MIYFRAWSAPLCVSRGIKFDDFSLDRDRYELLRSGRAIKLEKIPMELVILLATKDGHLVTRQEIIQHLWGEDVFLDTEHGINTAIRKIRLALRDDPDRPRFVQTVSGKGYRFVAELKNGNSAVSISQPEEALLPGRAVSTEKQSPVAPARSTTSWNIVRLVFAVALCLIGYFGWRLFRPAPPPAGHVMLAVLPFENLSGDPAQEYFSDGLTEEMITQLGSLSPEQLGVIARTTSMVYKHTSKSVQQIGQELGVDYVFESSVRRYGDEVRITTQLIRTRDQIHIWARNYDRHISGSIALQEEVAKAVAGQIEVKLSPAYASRPTRSHPDPQATEDYLRGRYFGEPIYPGRLPQGGQLLSTGH